MQKEIAGRICGLCRPPPLKTLHRSLLPDFTLENPDDDLQSECSLYRTPLKVPRVKTCRQNAKGGDKPQNWRTSFAIYAKQSRHISITSQKKDFKSSR